MSADRIPFKDTMLYPIVFMLIISFIFVGVLAAMYRSSEGKIKRYQTEQYQKLVLKLLSGSISSSTGISEAKLMADFPASFNKYITEKKDKGIGRRIFLASVNDSILAYCTDIGGKGLWGSMRALVSTNTSFDTILDFAIYAQMETPGLGARIGEEWFLKQFRGRPVIKSGKVLSLELIPEKQPSSNPLQINQVTGATITSVSVLKMLREELSYVYQKKQAQSE
ncbi:MAG: FMN-binding protein [Candidatus Cloacimonadaceae bacterium]|nr:FMN-binding protein [Candidatus Cloacimonadaceae bacterium]MDP3113922.1 FMN-binding protein [Candidatus Cloacimonadaceae bacterium]